MEAFLQEHLLGIIFGSVILGIIIGILIVKVARAIWSILEVAEKAETAIAKMNDVERHYSAMSSERYKCMEQIREVDKNLHYIKKVEQLEESQRNLKREQEKLGYAVNDLKRSQL